MGRCGDDRAFCKCRTRLHPGIMRFSFVERLCKRCRCDRVDVGCVCTRGSCDIQMNIAYVPQGIVRYANEYRACTWGRMRSTLESRGCTGGRMRSALKSRVCTGCRGVLRFFKSCKSCAYRGIARYANEYRVCTGGSGGLRCGGDRRIGWCETIPGPEAQG